MRREWSWGMLAWNMTDREIEKDEWIIQVSWFSYPFLYEWEIQTYIRTWNIHEFSLSSRKLIFTFLYPSVRVSWLVFTSIQEKFPLSYKKRQTERRYRPMHSCSDSIPWWKRDYHFICSARICPVLSRFSMYFWAMEGTFCKALILSHNDPVSMAIMTRIAIMMEEDNHSDEGALRRKDGEWNT